MTIADILPETSSRSTRGRCPMYSFVLNGEALDVLAQSATVVMGEGKHDLATITVSSPTLTTTENLTDQPISFRWGTTPRVESFQGYIMDVKEDTASGSNVSLTFTMSVLGSTKAMFDGKPKFWTNKSIPAAVKDLVNANQLGYAGHTHSHLWHSLAQTGESDWNVAIKFAKRLGWQIYNRYGVVACYDPIKLFTESGMYTRLVMGGSAGINIQADRILLDFQPLEEADALSSNLGLEYGYFTSAETVQVVRQPGEFRGYVFGSSVVIKDQDAAKVYADSGNIDMDRWKQYALARVWGDADIYPGMCVEVVSTNKTYVRTKHDGKWLVRQANHQMDRQQYQTLLSLARPTNKAPVSVPAYVPFWQQDDTKAKPTLTLINPAAKDEKSYWVSSWSDRRGTL